MKTLLAVLFVSLSLLGEDKVISNKDIKENVKIGFNYTGENRGDNIEAEHPKAGVIYGPGPVINKGTHEWLLSHSSKSEVKVINESMIRVTYFVKGARTGLDVLYLRNNTQFGVGFFWTVLHVEELSTN